PSDRVAGTGPRRRRGVVIARTWHGRVPATRADDYHEYLRRTGLADYEATPGNLGVLVFRRTEGDVTHSLLTTFWDSVESIRRFAGDDYTRARYYPEDDDYLLEREPLVTHYDVLEATLRTLDVPEGAGSEERR
ncbi:MAG: antibiotic biosynthesis monooxygenase family protein, partial [Gemmatimonadota bacterium]